MLYVEQLESRLTPDGNLNLDPPVPVGDLTDEEFEAFLVRFSEISPEQADRALYELCNEDDRRRENL